MNDDTIHVPIGEGASLDGGPFAACEVLSIEDGEMTVRPDEGGTFEMSVEDAQRYLAEEIERNEPVRVSGVSPDHSDASLELPVHDHYLIDLHGGQTALVSEVRDTDEWGGIRDCTLQYGADYYPNN